METGAGKRLPIDSCVERALTSQELPISETGLMNNWEELHSVETMEMQMINKQLFYSIFITLCIPIM